MFIRFAAPNNSTKCSVKWPWWLAAFDAAGIIILAALLGRIFMLPVEGALLGLLAPTANNSYLWPSGIFMLNTAAWEVFEIFLMLRLISLRVPLAVMLPWQPLGPRWRSIALFVLAVLVLQLAAFVAVSRFDPERARNDAQPFFFLMQSGLAGLTLFTGCVLAPIAEELMFRGFLLSAFSATRLGFWGAAALISMGWTMLHAYSLAGAVMVFTAGLLLCLLVKRSGNLLPGIVLHALYNAVVLSSFMLA